ncbi:hypothetical protein ACQKWADRAFT_10148 [Trichoderma austrokoningii]
MLLSGVLSRSGRRQLRLTVHLLCLLLRNLSSSRSALTWAEVPAGRGSHSKKRDVRNFQDPKPPPGLEACLSVRPRCVCSCLNTCRLGVLAALLHGCNCTSICTWFRHDFASHGDVLRDKQRWLSWLHPTNPLAAVPVPNLPTFPTWREERSRAVPVRYRSCPDKVPLREGCCRVSSLPQRLQQQTVLVALVASLVARLVIA